MAFFIPLTCVTLSPFYSISSLVLFTKNNNYKMRGKNIFCVYGYFISVSRKMKVSFIEISRLS